MLNDVVYCFRNYKKKNIIEDSTTVFHNIFSEVSPSDVNLLTKILSVSVCIVAIKLELNLLTQTNVYVLILSIESFH